MYLLLQPRVFILFLFATPVTEQITQTLETFQIWTQHEDNSKGS